MRGNGERIGPQNLPTSSIAGGIWNLLNQQRAQQRGAWPSATPAVVTDPYFMYVPLLLNTTSTNAQQNNTFLDSSSNAFTITRNGTPTQGAFTPYQPNGYWSGYFGGSSDYLTTPNSSGGALELAQQTVFTVECWVYPTSYNSSQATIAGTRNNLSGGWELRLNTSGTAQFYKTGVATSITSTATVPLNQWTYIAVTQNGSAMSLYVNSTSASNSTGAIGTVGTGSLGIGSDGVSTDAFAGYISNLRISNVVRTISVPTAPLSSDANTVLMCLQSNRFIDNSSSVRVLTANGTPKVQAFQPFSPAASYSAATYGGSGYFNGSTDDISFATNSAFTLGTNNFTIEAWLYPLGLADSNTALALDSSAYPRVMWIYTGGAFHVYASASGSSWQIDQTPTLVINAWNHLVFQRNGNDFRTFINGSVVATTTNSLNFPAQRSTGYIARGDSTSQRWNGYISNFRIVNGTAVYSTSGFTPPTAPVTAITNTSLLLNMTNAGIYDAAWQNNALTVGDAQASTTQYKWSPTSMKFDGTGDYLTATSSPGFGFGTGDFTIEAWVYLSSMSATNTIIDARASNSATAYVFAVFSNGALNFYDGPNNTDKTSTAGVVTANTWYYVAATRTSGTLRLYVNGTVQGTFTSINSNFGSDQPLRVGQQVSGSGTYNGYIQDLRITKGVARTITTPTAAFPTR